MPLDRYPTLDPAPGEVIDTEVYDSADVLVKAFALGPGAVLEPHEHAAQTNVFHILEGTVTVVQDDEAEDVDAPGVVVHGRGVPHGARNTTDDPAIFTATMGPMG